MKNLRSIVKPAAVVLAMAMAGPAAFAQQWNVEDRENPEQPGKRIELHEGDRLAASLTYGEGQMKTFLNVYGEDGELLTNPGLNKEGETVGRFPHHRGIFIGWNKIRSEWGVDDLWHMGDGGSIELADYDATATNHGVELKTTMHWRSRHRDEDNLLIEEERTMTVTRPGQHRTVVDFDTTLRAVKDVELDGDLQHAGVHFRGHHTVAERNSDTSYLWEPADLEPGGGRIVSDELKWAQLLMPRGDNWYLITQLDAPGNPTQELSWRDYGRFGFFHKDELAAGEERDLSYRFIIEQVDAPADGSNRSEAQKQAHRAAAEAFYNAYVESIGD